MGVMWDESAAKPDSTENRGPTVTVTADISNTSQVPVRILTFTEHAKLTIKKATKKEPAAAHNLNIKAAGLSFRSGNVAFIDGYLYIYPLSNLVRTMVNGSRIISKTIVCSGDVVTFGSEKNPLPVTIRFTYRQTKTLTESIAIYPVGTVGTPFDRRVLSFVIGRGTDCHYHNGQFNANCLSSTHAYITHTPKGIFLKNLSKSGTYILKDDRSAKIERERSVLIKAGDTIQFGSSKHSTTGFIRCAITIIDSTQLPKILTSVPPSSDQGTSSSSKQQSSSPLFDCTQCNMRFSSNNFLQSHMDRIHKTISKIAYQCPDCSAKFPTISLLLVHIESHHEDNSQRIFQCPLCDFKVKSDFSFCLHMNSKHTSGQPD